MKNKYLMKGIVQRAETFNKNGPGTRIYKTISMEELKIVVLTKHIKRLLEKIKKDHCL